MQSAESTRSPIIEAGLLQSNWSPNWPNPRDLDTFDRWFEWIFHSVVADLRDDPPLREELRPARAPALAAGVAGERSGMKKRDEEAG